jgi:hypothetical protein
LFRKGNIYYLTNSDCTGWNPNRNHYRTSTNLASGWSGISYLSTSSTTFRSQGGWAFKYKGSSDSTYIYFGDRWDLTDEISNSGYFWVPFNINGTSLSIDSLPTWYLDLGSGSWSRTPPTHVMDRSNLARQTKLDLSHRTLSVFVPGSYRLIVVDMKGRTVIAANAKEATALNVSYLPVGAYIAYVNSDREKIRQRIVLY